VPAQSYPIWKSRPVFISSTFLDMHAERDHMQNHVFPVLEERLKERFHHLEPIDLRWGVETRSADERQAKELLVLKVCLAEIGRSRPFLIVLLGDRYGWTPPAERMQAAAQEAGYQADLAGKSVTALEIEFGVLNSPQQRRRSRFYFRDPLPYAEMDAETAAGYSEQHSPVPGARAAFERLLNMKARIEREMPDRVRHYRAVWDAEKCRVTGLEEWGKQVLEDLWHDLEQGTREHAQKPGATWQEQEAWILEQYVETQCRDFVGREATLGELLKLAGSAASGDGDWCACVVGAPGSGKSSLFAKLCRELAGKDVLLLAHAAGISTRSTQVDTLLRRWTGELASRLGVPDPSPGITARDELEKAFAELLSRASVSRRVVCLIDALNQFERTPAARHLTWLPQLWPRNARLFATTIAGTESEVLGKRAGVQAVELPGMTATEAEQIARAVCRRYHKELPPDVLCLLVSKTRSDGRAAAGNPLWLELALEQLLLLDADDFAHADRDFRGTPEERLHALLVDTAAKFPPEVESLYGHLLERLEKVHGADLVRGFACVVGAGRAGWREADLRRLVPGAGGGDWEALRFAALRRGFRGHLVQRGALAQWDFSHAQVRLGVERRYLADKGARRNLHSTIADYLLSQPFEDPLRQTETMCHLIEADQRSLAARYCASLVISQDELAGAGATEALAAHILAGEGEGANPGLEWVVSLLHQELLEAVQLRAVYFLFMDCLLAALADAARVATRIALVEAVRESVEELQQRAPDSARRARDLSWIYNNLGDLQVGLGQPARALQYYEKALEISEESRRRAPDSTEYARDLSASYIKLGDLQMRRLGEPARALQYYEKALEIGEELRRRAPESPEYAYDLSINCERLGDLQVILGEPACALRYYMTALEISEKLRSLEPDNAKRALALSVIYGKLGQLHVRLEQPSNALRNYENSLAIRRKLRRMAPDSALYARDLSALLQNLGDLHKQEATHALEYYEECLAIREELHRRMPDHALYARDLSGIYLRLGDLYADLGEAARILDYYQKCLGIREHLRRRAPESAQYAYDLSISYERLGDYYVRFSEPLEPARALDYYQNKLAISQELQRCAPTNSEYNRDLVGSHSRLAAFCEQTAQPAKARLHWMRCLEALRAMQTANMPLDRQLRWLLGVASARASTDLGA